MHMTPTTTRVNEVDLGEIGRLAEACGGGLECAVGGAVAALLVLLLTGLVGLVLALALVNIGEATAAVKEERSRAAAERDAFAALARRIAALDPTPSGPVTRRDGGPMLATDRTTLGSYLPPVESAYRATVMDVAHYDEEYGESLDAHLTAEFGSDVSRALREADGLTPQLQTVLVSNARTASELRGDLVDRIDGEAEALAAAEHTLTDVDDRLVSMARRPITDRSYDELRRTWRRLDGLERECGDLLAARQDAIDGDSFAPHLRDDDAPDGLQAYLYEPLDVSYPVLADGARVADRVRTAKRRVFAALAAGPGIGSPSGGD